ncbi:MAG TPA: phosphoenolpyruvate--protein phosphotransferase [Aggregatilineales bacterium]|nr:phosphoenolpyruvate--protein phosphotransferase [Aggregatilineales bacterium]
MVGIVIVSHSAQLAEGVAELAREMAGPDVSISVAGGLDLPDRPLGTDAAFVMRAIEQVYTDEGVLILADMGSAILSAEMAIEMLPPEQQTNIRITEAPLVEGAVAAAIQARMGSSLDQVAAEARAALAGKIAHFASHESPAQAAGGALPSASQYSGEFVSVRLAVPNRLGLHARPAARVVQTAAKFRADVTLTNSTTRRGPVNAKSINAVATLGIKQHDTVEIAARGPEAAPVLDAMRALAARNFGDEGDELPPPPVSKGKTTAAEGALHGLATSPGVAVGKAVRAESAALNIPIHAATNPQEEWTALLDAFAKTRVRIQSTINRLGRKANPSATDIFEAHLLFLDDEALREPARQAIFESRLNAAAAWEKAFEAVAQQYAALDDPYMQLRAADVRDVGTQVIAQLLGQAAAPITLDQPGILVANDLTPASTANLDSSLVLGICCAQGSNTSHSAILARMLGIPAVMGLGASVLTIAPGTLLIVDGSSGDVMISPDKATQRSYLAKMEALQTEKKRIQAESAQPAVTRDGRTIEVVANIGSIGDARQAVSLGAEGVGLFRTEFLFLDRQTEPTEDEQYEAYFGAAEAMGGRPLIIRTLDAGGDKPLPYIDQGTEDNPFLGWRAIRLCLAQPDLFKTQLRAIVRAAARYPVRIMFPMIAVVDELHAAKDLLLQAYNEVHGRGQAVPDRLEVGIMVEIPAAAVRAEHFAPEVDFFSIGTNDLTQYTMAAERGNPHVAYLSDALHPAVIMQIQNVVEIAHRYQKWVGVCGELAGDPIAIPLLVGLGVDELSMNAPAIPRAKQIVRSLTYADAQTAAAQALSLTTAEQVRAMYS